MKCIICKWYRENRKDGNNAHCDCPDAKWNVGEAIWNASNQLIGCPYGKVQT